MPSYNVQPAALPMAGIQMLGGALQRRKQEKKDAPRQALIEAAKKTLLGGGDFFESHISEAQKMMMAGEDATEILNAAEQGMKDPEAQKIRAEKILAMYDPEAFKQYRALATGKGAGKEYAPSPLKKLMTEREELIQEGYALDSPEVKAYDNKITGVDIDIKDMSQDEVDTWGAWMNLSGKMPSLGRGKQSTKIRVAIAKSAARQALGAELAGVPEGTPEQTPAEAALEMVGSQADTKAIQGSLNFLDKQLSSMGSFVTNLNSQVDRVVELSGDLKTFDTRLLNIPLRALRGKIKGSPLQAKYDMFLTEIESEIGKLATGSTGSVAELSASAQEKWSHIHDKNLSIKDMLSLLQETKTAANLRIKSVRDQLDKTRKRMKTREFGATGGQEITTQGEYDALPDGSEYIYNGKKYRKKQ